MPAHISRKTLQHKSAPSNTTVPDIRASELETDECPQLEGYMNGKFALVTGASSGIGYSLVSISHNVAMTFLSPLPEIG
jgi:hypothetical protein